MIKDTLERLNLEFPMFIKTLDLTHKGQDGFSFYRDNKYYFPLYGSTYVDVYLRSHVAIMNMDPYIVREIFNPPVPQFYFSVKDLIPHQFPTV